MRLLFEMDMQDWAACTHTFARPSARSIIIRDKKVAMIYSPKYDYYKFPGGGIEGGESPIDAMIRETKEEAGLTVLPESVREYGFVHRIQQSDYDCTECFVQDNYYYLCNAETNVIAQHLDTYEANEGFSLQFVDAATAIQKNRSTGKTVYDPVMFEREARVLEMLVAEGLL